MNTRIKKLWLKTLRSGRYLQTKGLLHRRVRGYDRFCCLGVLTNLYVEETGDAEVWYASPYKLSRAVMEWSEIGDASAAYDQNGQSLATDNDRGASFAEIADTIEEHF